MDVEVKAKVEWVAHSRLVVALARGLVRIQVVGDELRSVMRG
jgi:hypothetical protein